MKQMLKSTIGGALGVLLLAGVSQAAVVFQLGNNPQPNEENVLFGSSQTGTTITGTTNQSSTGIEVTSSQSLSTGGVGQAFLEATSGGLITNFAFSVPGESFEDFIFNPMIGGRPGGGGGTAEVTAFLTGGGTEMFSYALGNGNNFLTLFTDAGETLDSVSVSVTGAGFNQLKQLRVSGISGVDVPEPASIAMLGFGLTALGLFGRKRSRH